MSPVLLSWSAASLTRAGHRHVLATEGNIEKRFLSSFQTSNAEFSPTDQDKSSMEESVLLFSRVDTNIL